MRCDQVPVALRDVFDEPPHLRVRVVQLLDVDLSAFPILRAVGRIRQGQLLGDDLGIADAVGRVVPQVRVNLTVDVLAQDRLRQQVGLVTWAP